MELFVTSKQIYFCEYLYLSMFSGLKKTQDPHKLIAITKGIKIIKLKYSTNVFFHWIFQDVAFLLIQISKTLWWENVYYPHTRNADAIIVRGGEVAVCSLCGRADLECISCHLCSPRLTVHTSLSSLHSAAQLRVNRAVCTLSKRPDTPLAPDSGATISTEAKQHGSFSLEPT